ncbi:DUF2332 family protein [Microlunatus elymi]|uniref:DUF2332 family protein n=1 Tax=Microlunatus elymi TaxID=2596828 RepID=A0A516Q447_9ACTN|nr:DUF2332 family protein [Microlunatus elymi]
MVRLDRWPGGRPKPARRRGSIHCALPGPIRFPRFGDRKQAGADERGQARGRSAARADQRRRPDRRAGRVGRVGCSAGLLLAHDGYRYSVAGATWGANESPVHIDFEWRSTHRVPDLDLTPELRVAVGIDLNPIDPGDPDDRAWMQALVWPENLHEAALLDAALSVLATDPPRRVVGDARRLIAPVVRDLPPELSVVIFHAATRAHVPPEDRPEFDDAINQMGASHTLFHLSLEGSADPRFRRHRGSFLLTLEERRPGEPVITSHLALVDQHGEWIRPLD